ncbi:glycosyltransferase [Candidatus Pacearchaeota archaeon]|nr:glycosyltransferase [Candidatus Pacearchaeota archaeon]
MGRIKVCLIYEFLSEQGGLEREIINHANFLKQAGFDVEVLTCHLNPEILKLMPFEGIKITNISKIKTPFESLNLILCFFGLNNLNKYSPGIFLSYSAPCNYLIRKKRCKKANYINHVPHFLYLSGKEKAEWASSTQGVKRWMSVALSYILGYLLKKIDKRLVRKNDLNFANSKFTKKTIDRIYSISSIVSYPPLDPRFKPFNPSKAGIKERFIFSSSRIIPDKKYEWLIEALSYMKSKLPLYIAGSVQPDYRKKLLGLAEKMKVKINFLGRLNTEQIREYYSNASVFAFPAPKEDFGLVPAESLACGTPVVVWGDGAGPTEQVIDGVNGFYAQPYNIKDFARKSDLCIDTNFKKKNKNKIIKSSRKFSTEEIKKGFIKEINKILFSRP